MDTVNVPSVRVNSHSDLTEFTDHPPRASPTSTDGWGELENGIDEDKDGRDDIEPLEESKPSSALASIQAAQKQLVSQPKSRCNTSKEDDLKKVPSSRPKSALKTNNNDDDDAWGSVAHPTLKSTSKPLNSKSSEVDVDPWGDIAASVPKTSSKPLNLKSSGSADDLWASIAAPPPTTGPKPVSSGRGRGTKPAAPKLGAQRINRTSSGM